MAKTASLTMGFLRVLIPMLCSAACVAGFEMCKKNIVECEGDSCSKSIPCYHGDCSEDGTCECDLCWQGGACDQYVDRYLPEFPVAEETTVVSDPWSPEPVYTAQAVDGDLGSTCPQDAMICDCGETRYQIVDGDPEGLFHINNLTGDIYFREAPRVVSGKTYALLISAESAKGQRSPSPNAHMRLKVVIDDLHHHLANLLQENVLPPGSDDVHSREKRSTENENHKTEFNFTLLSGELEYMEMGKRLDYKLEILVPKTDGMDLTVELFTKEIGNGNYTPVLALFNVEAKTKSNGITFLQDDKPHIEMLLNEDIVTVYDRAIVTFGEVKNADEDLGAIEMFFSVTQIKNPQTIFDSKYLVTAGAEYDKETYVWVGQYEVTVHNSTDERSIEVELLGPNEIPLDSAGVYVLMAHCAVRSDNFTFEIAGPEEPDVVSVGNLGVKDFDKNYDPVPQSIYFYNTTKEGSDDDVIYKSATMNLGIMTNIGEYKAPKDEGNVINVTFAIYALNNETNIGKVVEFKITITVGREILHSDTYEAKIVPRVDEQPTITAQYTESKLSTPEVGEGDMAIYTFWSNLTNDGYADYVMEVGVQRDTKGLPRLEACSARLWNYPRSFDIPYINSTFIDPEVKDGKFIFTFNRIHVTAQRKPSIYNDSMMYIHLVVKVSSLEVNKEGTQLSLNVKVGTQGKADQEITVPDLVIREKEKPSTLNTDAVNGMPWEFLYLGGAVVVNITMEIPKGQGYAQMLVESSGEKEPPLPPIHLCRAELSYVGRNVPCLRMHQQEVNDNFTTYDKLDPKTRKKPDKASVMLGDVGALPVEGENTVVVSVVVEMPEGTPNIKENDYYPISAGVMLSEKSIVSLTSNYTMKKGPPPELEKFHWPEASAIYVDGKKVVPGHLAEIEVIVDTKYSTISTYAIEVEGTTRDISLCGLKVKSYGRNLPCVDLATEPYYQAHDNPLDGNKIAGIKFSALSNVGFRPKLEHDRLVLVALVRIGPSCKVPEAELQWRVIFGGGKRDGQIIIPVDLDADTSDMLVTSQEPKALAFKAPYPNKAVALGTPVLVDLEVSLEPGSLAPVMVSLKNPDKKRIPYDVCLGGIWFRGRNYPCFSPVQVESNFSSSDPESNHNDTAVYNLGLVCNTFVDSKEEENKVTLRLVLRPLDDGTISVREKFSVEGHAAVGSYRTSIDTIKFTIAREADQIETGVNASVKAVYAAEPVSIGVHRRSWIPFNITIPVDAVVKVSVEARAPQKSNRAILTVHNIRLVSGGKNIPCPMLYPQPEVKFVPSVPTTQSDVISAYLGVFTNLGLSHKMNMAVDGDDDLTVEVQVEMSDHPLTEHGAIFQLEMVARVGSNVVRAEQPMKVYRDGKERADLDVKLKVDNSKPYQSKDRINVTVSVVHTEASTAEPVNATIRLYLPPYVEYDKSVSNATVVGSVQFITEFGGLDIVIPQFLFSDTATIVVSLLADPKNNRGFGRGEVNATTPYRVLCKQNFREEPKVNPETEDTIVNCGPIDYIMYVINSQECYENLGLFTPKKIYKCQLSASSAAKRDHGPNNIRKGSKKGWFPALRLGPHKPYFQVDFLRTTRLSKLEFFKVENTRSVTKYRLKYSHTGSDWLDANEVTVLTYKNNAAVDKLERPIQTRFVRVVIEEAEKGEEDSKYIGLKMEMYGCYIAEKLPSVTCSKHDPTWYSDDKTKYGRHFSVDVGRDIIYFCDLEYDMENLVCFSSTDAGNSWRILPKSIGGILGYDKKSGRTYAFDKRNRAYLASDDGVSWVAVSQAEVNTTMMRKSFQAREPVPAFTSEDIDMLEAKSGRWQATFDGLMYDGKPDPRARWSRCCKMNK